LVQWHFEDCIKKAYIRFIELIEIGSHDIVTHHREQLLQTVFELLSCKPEQEKRLLSLLINKLGDREKSLCSKATYYLTRLVQKFPSMALAVTKEVHQFIFRPNVGLRAQYYAVLFLNQLILSRHTSKLTEKLMEAYFSLFQFLMNKTDHNVSSEKFSLSKESGKRKTENPSRKGARSKKLHAKSSKVPLDGDEFISSKLLDAILTGINRAFPFAKFDSEFYQKHIDNLFRIAHISTFNKSVQVFHLLFQVMLNFRTISDRYYRALYERLIDHRIFHNSKQSLFFNVLYKSLQADMDIKRISAFLKRICQIAAYGDANFCVQLYI